MGKLEGKVAFITGVARGQGRAHAVRLAQEGADIVGIDICADLATSTYPNASEADLKETARLVEALGRRIVARQADVRDLFALTAVMDEARSAFGRVDIVLANAGVSPMTLNPTDVVQNWRDVVDTNLTGAFNTVQAALPLMVEGGAGGNIVFTASTAALKGSMAWKTVAGYGYAASKHGLIGLMRAFAFDLAEQSIRVNAVVPTGVNTPMVNNEAMGALLANNPGAGDALVNLLPVQVIEPEDVSNAIAWLVSDEARYVTGVVLPVDAGFTSK